MKSNYKSPSKYTSKSVPYSHIPRSQNKPISPSKCKKKFELSNDIYACQAYRNVLSKLVSQNNIQGFLKIALNYVIFTDQIVHPFINSIPSVKISQSQFQQLGKALLRDGSFIKHYCKLLITKNPVKQTEIKQYIYHKYKDNLSEKLFHFEQYFKEEINTEKIQIQSKSQKSSSKIGVSIFSFQKDKSPCKKSSQSILKKSRSVIKDIDTQSQIDFRKEQKMSERSISSLSQKSNITPKIIRQNKNQNNQDEEQYPIFPHISSRKKKPQTQDQRERRLFGLSNTQQSQKSGKFRTNIVSSRQIMQSNPSLKKSYESIKKQRQEIRLKQSSIKKQKLSQQLSPIRRNQIRQLMTEMNKIRIQPLHSRVIEKLTLIQQQLLKSNIYPNITKFGFKKYIEKQHSFKVGEFKNKIIKKCQITDMLQFGEPTYVAIYLEDKNVSIMQNKQNKQFDMTDETVIVVLVEQFEKEPLFHSETRRKDMTFGKSDIHN